MNPSRDKQSGESAPEGHAKAQDKAWSDLGADNSALVDHSPGVSGPGRLVQSLRGVLRDSGLDEEDYRNHLAKKHR